MPTVDQLITVLAEVESTIRARFTRRLSIIASRYDVDDLIGDVTLKCYEAIGSCRAQTETELRHWVLTTAKYTAETKITSHRAAKRSTVREQVAIGVATDESRDGYQPAIDGTVEMVAELQETYEDVTAALEHLPEMQAKVIRMLYVEGREYAEIAQCVGWSVETCRSIVSRGLKTLRAKLVKLA